ncbi:aminodeoxychorismate lyase [Pantoea sp. ACRSB]|uniref:aminodeoxychorismate lyase n=1 Tax=Pantoea sp. ACRSB TaxID=2918207 RepID=UPI0028936314|nr:aminodeoxychorismate lyase [Pantoea sp. ACRSB]MCG7387442.1 aminodeoxychorismate lyase [Pantoea sp. ACRSB]
MWINGTEQLTLSASDRATQFGDGCFTTAAVDNGHIQLQDAHLRRLRQGCERLMMPDVDWTRLEREMRIAAQPHKQAVLKVIISAGSGGRGYSRKGVSGATRIVSVAPWPHHYLPLQTQGVKLQTSPVRLAQNPLLAGIKHLNRLEQVLIRAHLDQSDADEALVLDTAGNVVECCAANLFWRQGERIFTPDLTQSGVDGIMRRYLMAQMAAAGEICHVIRCEPAQLLAADEIVICNALMPVLPVRQLDDRLFSERTLYRRLQESCYLMEAK